MTAKEKMHSGALYLPMDEELFQEQMRCLDRLYDFNQTRPSELDRRAALLRELSAIGNNVNQIAHNTNAAKAVTQSEIDEAVRLVRKAWRLVKEAL